MWVCSTCICYERYEHKVCIVRSGFHGDAVYMHMLRTAGGQQSITNGERRFPAEPCGGGVYVYVTNRKCLLFVLVPSGAMWMGCTCICYEQLGANKVSRMTRGGSKWSHVEVVYMLRTESVYCSLWFPVEPCGCGVHAYVTNNWGPPKYCEYQEAVPSGAMWMCSTCICYEQRVCIVRSGSQRSHVEVVYMYMLRIEYVYCSLWFPAEPCGAMWRW
ncbi:hypothetical protein DPMN_021432 [Dreissena polymorpha]|uniref:Uncharacterized protein n=1 Tax=Dreissena polymorpha TaxID=45954 RepID=A0A9D4NM14_DREPO|nr:hypothetical protein DPMN_021432 [Dreissena polymorpha]